MSEDLGAAVFTYCAHGTGLLCLAHKRAEIKTTPSFCLLPAQIQYHP